MRFNKLRLLGFKSFVEPTEFLIENGLTGVVGPNGCGKSNLVEALRWVMGENSYKNMRASGMDDVIFSGSGNRPSRNSAEVILFLDNSDRKAPAAFNDADELQVSRRIERESGSVYRINGKEVRAKDVQLLFADASTGARSPSMVGQGRIGELISAKPQARRALLEEAAGISGLHSRRHDAELRLRAADQNLERLEDVIGQFDTQLESLKRQARQANRYRAISNEIRQSVALAFHIRWTNAKSEEAEAESRLTAATATVGDRAELQAHAAKEQAVVQNRLPGLREAEATAAATLQRLTMARKQLDEEMGRLANRREELEQRLAQLNDDIGREERMIGDNADMIRRLDDEEAELKRQSQLVTETEKSSREALEAATAKLAVSERELGELTSRFAEENTLKSLTEKSMREAEERHRRLSVQMENLQSDYVEVVGKISSIQGSGEEANRANLLENRVGDLERDIEAAEAAVEGAETAARRLLEPLDLARRKLNEIETEAKTINRVLNQGVQDLFPAIVEKVKVEPGYEKALGAAFGDDLELSTERSAPARWQIIDGELPQQTLPEGVQLLSDVVAAPQELARRLGQTGIINAEDATWMVPLLKPGQRLVSIDGDLWRWDGLETTSEAPSAAAMRLSQKNRLLELETEARNVSNQLREAETNHQEAVARLENARLNVRQTRDQWTEAQRELRQLRETIAAAERASSDLTARRSALEEAKNRVSADLQEALATRSQAEAQLAAIVDLSGLEHALTEARTTVAEQRAEAAEIRARFEGLSREAEARGRRLETIKSERHNWQRRAENAEKQIAQLVKRRDQTAAELQSLEDAPNEIEQRRRGLLGEIEIAEKARSQAADNLAAAENELSEADRAAREAITRLSEARETRARAEERLNAATERRTDIERRIREEMECAPEGCLKQAAFEGGTQLPDASIIEARLEKLKAERERLGAVNLRAEAEQVEIAEQREALISERDDLIEAIRRLRAGIGSLNREGRERLLEAFDVVNGQFQRLFTHLFGGGTAELQLVESDDPLEAGLEIMARPPGKRPQTMTLLSGGEQALTAMALIFAVFLTNPAPICVLDEVDAPLDDHNVERFCNLMDEMVASTDTRFVIITHNPISMARMSRLFGVTMAERGVSQLVSVDLQEAERLREAG